MVLGAKAAPAPTAPKGLADRMSYVQMQLFPDSAFANDRSRKPKSAARDRTKRQDKPKTNGAPAATTNGAAKGQNTRNKKSGRAGRP